MDLAYSWEYWSPYFRSTFIRGVFGHSPNTPKGDTMMEWLAIGIAAFAVIAYTMILYVAGNRKETE